MVFSKHNYMIGAVIVYVFFYFNDIVVALEQDGVDIALEQDGVDIALEQDGVDNKVLSCLDALVQDGLNKQTGFQNFASKVAKLDIIGEYAADLAELTQNMENIKKKINEFKKPEEKLSTYGRSYVKYLTSLVTKPEHMLPPATWCEIEDCITKSSSLLPDTEFDVYVSNASLKINNDNKNKQICTINVCYENITTPINIQNDESDKEIKKDDLISHDFGFQKMYSDSYASDKKKFFRREPLTWCVIQASYTILLKKGYKDVPAEENRQLTIKLVKDKQSLAYRYLHFIHPEINSQAKTLKPITSKLDTSDVSSSSTFLPSKSKNIDYTLRPVKATKPVNEDLNIPINIYQLYEYPLNWCAVDVCHNDLINAGFKFVTFQENYKILSEIKTSVERSIGKRFVQIVDEVVLSVFGDKIKCFVTEYINTYIGKIIGKFIVLLNECAMKLFLLNYNYVQGKIDNYVQGKIASFMDSYIGDFLGIKFKKYLIKKCYNEEPGKYLQYLFEKVIMGEKKKKIYQSEFVYKYSLHLEKLINRTKESEEDKEYFIPADRVQRNPRDWCMVTVIFPET